MLEESPPGRQAGSDFLVALTQKVEGRRHEICRQEQGRQDGREVLLAVSVAMLVALPLGFERVVVFVFDFPAAAACRYGVLGARSRPGVAVEEAPGGVGRGRLAPPHEQRIVAVLKR